MSLRANEPQDSQASALQKQLLNVLKEVDRLKDERLSTVVANSEFHRQATDEISQLREQLSEQARLAGEWYEKASSAEAELEQLRSQPVGMEVVDPEVFDLLREALNLRANAGGAIKEKVRQALALLTKS